MAALWPGIPLTPPPRRAPAPQTRTLAIAVSTPHVPTSDSSSANGHVRSRWKMLPPGSPSSASSSTGVRASRHGSPDGVDHRQSSIGSASTLFSDRSVASIASAFASRWVPANSRAGMCSPKHVSVCAPALAQLGRRGSTDR